MITLTAGTKGEILLPKKIREAIGLKPGGEVTLNVKENSVEIRPKEIDVVARAEERAKRLNLDVSKIKMGDELYEELF